MFKITENTVKSYKYLIAWLVISLIGGIAGVLVVHSFAFLLELVSGLLCDTGLPWWVWPLAGALAAGGVLYRICPDAAGEGIPSFIQGIENNKGALPVAATFFKYWAALVTLGTFGCGGIVGPLGRVTAGIVTFTVGRVRVLKLILSRDALRIAAVCGLAASLGAIFHVSIGGGILAVEIIHRANMRYKDLFPGIMASCVAVFICKAIGWESFYTFQVPDEFMECSKVGWLFLCAILSGLVGGGYEKLYLLTSRFFKRAAGIKMVKLIAGSMIAFFIAYLVNPGILGTSREFIPALIKGRFQMFSVFGNREVPLFCVLVVIMLCKLLCNCIVVGSGMSAGFTGPAVIAGMLLGAAFALCVGVEPGSATYYAFLCCGFAGVLSGSMNIPIAASIMAIELFGLQYGFAAGLASIIAFQMSRETTIYGYYLEEEGFEHR